MAKTQKHKSVIEKNEIGSAFDQAIMRWKSPDFLRYERGLIWYLFFGSANIGLILYAYFTGSWTMGIVFLLVPLIYLLEHYRKPKIVDVVVSAYGIKFGDMRIPFSSIEKFWILHDPPHLNELKLKTNKKVHPEVTIPLLNMDPSIIRHYLVTQIPEWEGKKEDFLDLIIRVLKLA